MKLPPALNPRRRPRFRPNKGFAHNLAMGFDLAREYWNKKIKKKPEEFSFAGYF